MPAPDLFLARELFHCWICYTLVDKIKENVNIQLVQNNDECLYIFFLFVFKEILVHSVTCQLSPTC